MMRGYSFAVRVVLLVAAVLLWKWLSATHPEFAQGVWGANDERVYRWGWVAAVVLGLYVVAGAGVMVTSRKKGGPDAAMGIGCGYLVLGALLVAEAVLVAAVVFRVKALVVVMGVGVLGSAVMVVGGLMAEGWKAVRKRRGGGV
jgi:hypothetical protein